MKTKHFNKERYEELSRRGPCFVCEIVAGNPAYPHHMIVEDEEALVFLDNYPTQYGYTLVAPKEHLEQVTADFSPSAYMRIQTLIYRVAQAIRQITPVERIYILSLGSQQANSHVHWHIVPLPPGVPFDQQQLEALRKENGLLDLSQEEMADLAGKIRQVLLQDNSSD